MKKVIFIYQNTDPDFRCWNCLDTGRYKPLLEYVWSYCDCLWDKRNAKEFKFLFLRGDSIYE